MSRTASFMLPLNTVAPDFSLPNTIDGEVLSLQQIKGKKGTLVIFMCNHCPYVLHLLDKMVEIIQAAKTMDIHTVAISSNDVAHFPEDGPDKMKALALERGFSFPYLYDESQEVAMAYQAACTPDFYLFDQDLRLVYRGRFDDARPKNDHPITGIDLKTACKNLHEGKKQAEPQIPSLGCNIKWKKGNEPEGFFN